MKVDKASLWLLTAALWLFSASPTEGQCLGDFNDDKRVTIDEMVTVVINGLNGCELDVPPEVVLERNRAKWTARGVQEYEFVYRLFCFCFFDLPHDAVIRVEEGEIVSVHDLWTGTPVDNPPPDAYRTVEQMFDLLEDAFAENADSVTVTYDIHTGSPRELFIDYYEPGFDDEIGITVPMLRILRSGGALEDSARLTPGGEGN